MTPAYIESKTQLRGNPVALRILYAITGEKMKKAEAKEIVKNMPTITTNGLNRLIGVDTALRLIEAIEDCPKNCISCPRYKEGE